MAERLNTTFSRRTSSKRRITNIANRFDQIKGEVNAHQTAQGLREDMRDALSKFGEINEQLWSLLEAAEVSADRTTTSHTVSEDISDSDQYVTKAEDTLFEISRYLENHPAEVNPAVSIAASVPSSARGHKISFRAMTHDDCRLWFAQLEDVFASLGISSQNNKFAALTTLLTEEEAYVVRDLTMMGDERPSNVFDAAMSLFVKRYELTVHQRITRAISMNGLAVDEKPSQWMARFRHAGGEWDREDVERWALLRHLPSSLRTTLELPTPQLSMDELLQKADTLYVTLPSATVSAIPEMPTELAAAVTSGDLPAINALFKRRDGMVEMATRRRNNSNAGTMSNSAMSLGVAADHPARDITQTCPKVAQQSRETPRAVDNRCRIWLAQTYNKTTPLHGRVPH